MLLQLLKGMLLVLLRVMLLVQLLLRLMLGMRLVQLLMVGMCWMGGLLAVMLLQPQDCWELCPFN